MIWLPIIVRRRVWFVLFIQSMFFPYILFQMLTRSWQRPSYPLKELSLSPRPSRPNSFVFFTQRGPIGQRWIRSHLDFFVWHVTHTHTHTHPINHGLFCSKLTDRTTCTRSHTVCSLYCNWCSAAADSVTIIIIKSDTGAQQWRRRRRRPQRRTANKQILRETTDSSVFALHCNETVVPEYVVSLSVCVSFEYFFSIFHLFVQYWHRTKVRSRNSSVPHECVCATVYAIYIDKTILE